MSKKYEESKKLVLAILEVESFSIDEVTVEETRQLEFYISRGHWEVLPKNRAFLQLAPEGKVQTLVQAIENRIIDLRRNLMPLGRTENTRDAYIQILNRARDFERLKEEILEEFYAKTGRRRISKESKGKKIYF